MNKSKSSLFLMELIFAVLIFAIASTVCVRVFVKAYNISCSTKELNNSVTRCTSAAELFYGTDGDLSKMKTELDAAGQGAIMPGSLVIYYDETFQQCQSDESVYIMTIENTRKDDMLECSIEMYNDRKAESIYSLKCELYTGYVKDSEPLSEPASEEMQGTGGVL